MSTSALLLKTYLEETAVLQHIMVRSIIVRRGRELTVRLMVPAVLPALRALLDGAPNGLVLEVLVIEAGEAHTELGGVGLRRLGFAQKTRLD